MRLAILLILLAGATAALAQQPSPPETALQINGVIGQWAQTLGQQARLIEQLQAELAKANIRIKELEPSKPDKPADKDK